MLHPTLRAVHHISNFRLQACKFKNDSSMKSYQNNISSLLYTKNMIFVQISQRVELLETKLLEGWYTSVRLQTSFALISINIKQLTHYNQSHVNEFVNTLHVQYHSQ